MSKNDRTHASPSPSRHDTDRTVLLADDDTDLRATLRIWIEDVAGWDILEASNGADALSKVTDAVDVVVVDRQMPRVSGPAVVERLRERAFDGSIIVLSAFRADTHLDDDMVSTYLTKPIDRGEFIGALD